jgi:alginate O-acetyltransferase complex protein AlgI
MGKKVLLANPLGDIADVTFAQSPHLHSIDAWFGLAAYSFQIYFDFSGYTDMAIGLALMMGFEFSKNFDSPYKAQSITDFWRRWHISLSTWLRDYLYIPLGGNRKGETRTYFNLITVMLLGGLWHGAAWKYVIWGGIHGSWLAVERLLGKRSFYNSLPKFLRVGFTFLIVSIAWIFFRATGYMDAFHYLKLMIRSSASGPMADLMSTALYTRGHVVALFFSAGIAFFGAQTWDLSKRVTPLRAAMALGLLTASIGALATQSNNPFLYFQF